MFSTQQQRSAMFTTLVAPLDGTPKAAPAIAARDGL
jgi:hypothetical protein